MVLRRSLYAFSPAGVIYFKIVTINIQLACNTKFRFEPNGIENSQKGYIGAIPA